MLQRVGGRAGTAAPQGAVCELPNPLLLSDWKLNLLFPARIAKYRIVPIVGEKYRFNPLHSLTVFVAQNVGVDVQGRPGIGMSKLPLSDLDPHRLRQ